MISKAEFKKTLQTINEKVDMCISVAVNWSMYDVRKQNESDDGIMIDRTLLRFLYQENSQFHNYVGNII